MFKSIHSKIYLCAFALLLSAPQAMAELQYWVSVHSFERVQNAERAVAGTAQELAESFRVLGVSTGKGFYYRVASGPYLSREIADEQVRTAHQAGFEGAWLWADDKNVFDSALDAARNGATSGTPSAATSEAQRALAVSNAAADGVNTQYDTDYQSTSYDSFDATTYDVDYTDSSYDLPDYDNESFAAGGLGGDVGENDPDLLMQRQPPPELVDEAPPGYKLNKLHRDE